MSQPIESCEGLRAAVELLAKRWTLLIVELLLQRLRELVDSGLATREVDPGPPLAATYALTDRGRRLEPVIEALRAWSDEALAAAPD